MSVAIICMVNQTALDEIEADDDPLNSTMSPDGEEGNQPLKFKFYILINCDTLNGATVIVCYFKIKPRSILLFKKKFHLTY